MDRSDAPSEGSPPAPTLGDPHVGIVLPPEPGPWWWACRSPERPHDAYAMYAASDCPACAIALEALMRRDPAVFMDQRDPKSGRWLRDTNAAGAFDIHASERSESPEGVS